MAPESYDDILREPSADVYSFAIIMYILRYGFRLWTLPYPVGQAIETIYQERGLSSEINKCNRPPLSDTMVFREAPVFRIGAEAALELRKAFSKNSLTKKHSPLSSNLAWNPEKNVWERNGDAGLPTRHAVPSVESYLALMYALAARALVFTSLASAGKIAGMKTRQNDPK
jgi:hypothetical protein